jgi:hypothetical protein
MQLDEMGLIRRMIGRFTRTTGVVQYVAPWRTVGLLHGGRRLSNCDVEVSREERRDFFNHGLTRMDTDGED